MFHGFGYDIHHKKAPYEKTILDMKNSGSSFHVVVTESINGVPTQENFETICRYHNDLYPVYGDNLILLWRFFKQNGQLWREYNTKVYLTVLSAWNLPKSVVIDSLSHEPDLNGSSYTSSIEYVRHELNNLRDFKNYGIKYAVGAFASETPNEVLIKKGVYDSVITEAEFFSVYLSALFPFEAGETHTYDLMNKTASNRDTIRSILFDRKRWPSDHKSKRIGLLNYWEARAIELGVEMPKTFVSFTLDHIESVPADIKSNWYQDFGMFEYDNRFMGLLSWVNHFKWVFPDLSLGEIYSFLLLHLRDNIINKKFVCGISLLSYNHELLNGYNIEDDLLRELRNKHLKELNMTTTVIKDEPVKYDLMWSTNVTNVRLRPLVTQPLNQVSWYLTDVKESVTILDNNVTDFDGKKLDNKYTWVKFLRHKDNLIYYVAKTQYLQIVDNDEIYEDSRMIVDYLGFTQVTTKGELKELRDLVLEIKDFVASLDDDIEEDDEHLLDLLKEFLDVRREASEVNKETTIKFFDRIIQGIDEATVL